MIVSIAFGNQSELLQPFWLPNSTYFNLKLYVSYNVQIIKKHNKSSQDLKRYEN